MGVKIINLPEFTGLPVSGDYLAMTDGSVTSKLNYSLLAQAIVENYEASELAGEQRSPKAAIDALAGLLAQAQNDIEEIQTAMQSVDELTLEYSSSFQAYTTGGEPHLLRYGRVVVCYGTAKPTATITGGTTAVTMFTIPEGWRPIGRTQIISQGSGRRLWLVSALNTGEVTYARMRGSWDSWFDAPTTEWLPFTLIYICEETPAEE